MADSSGGRAVKRASLGRGLSALVSQVVSIPAQPVEKIKENANSDEIQTGSHTIKYIPLNKLAPSKYQPRKSFSDLEIQELAASIKDKGVLQPILVRPSAVDIGQFEIIAGERRFRAATLAAIELVPVIIRDSSDLEVLGIALIENVQRSDLNPVEEARGYQRLIDEFNLSAAQVGDRVGKDRATVANLVRVLNLSAPVLSLLEEGKLSLGHSKVLLSVREPGVQLQLARKIIDEHLSVRALESIVSREITLESPRQAGQDLLGKKSAKRRANSSGMVEIEDRLRGATGTKVVLKAAKNGRGVVELHYFSEQELDRLVDLLTRN